MGKMRNYTYGSPKFEGELNKVISEAGGDVKIYQHSIMILANDASNTPYYYEYTVYNTSSDPLIDTYTPTYMDVINLLVDTITYSDGLTPAYFSEGKFYYFIAIKGEENSLTAYYYDIQSQDYSDEATITKVSVAYDTVREM